MKKMFVYGILLLCLAGVVQAVSLTTRSPISGGYLSTSTALLNVSYAQDYLSNVTNVTWTLSGSVVCYDDHYPNASVYNCTWNSKSKTDDASYTFSVKAINSTTDILETLSVSFTPDNTKPTCVFGEQNNKNYDQNHIWTVTGANASSATITLAGASHAMSESSDVFTWSGNPNPGGALTVSALTSDGRNSTSCQLVGIGIEGSKSSKIAAAVMAAQQQEQVSQTESNINMETVLIVAGIAWLGYVVLKKKK